MIACTIIARNYLAAARVLARSFLDHHPDSRLEVLLVDDRETGPADPVEVFNLVRPADLGLAAGELHRMAAIYDVTELSTALKPFLLALLTRRHGVPVTYLDPDIQVFAPLDDCDELAAQHGIVLTPHLLKPMARDGKYPSEVHILQAGGFNLGFIAVGPETTEFLTWWGERLRRDCLRAVPDGLFVDQRWIDLAIHYFPYFVHRDDTLNVAYWNLDTRTLTAQGAGYLVNGRPLRFFHFSGYLYGQTEVLVKYVVGEPRIRPAENPALERICRQYSDLLQHSGQDECQRTPYGFASSAGDIPLTRALRRTYRSALLDGAEPPPDPFDAGQVDAFERWAGLTVVEPEPVGAARIARLLPEPVARTLRPMWRAGRRLRSDR